MPDWLASMQQSYEYYIVDPGTWKDVKRVDTVKSCTINRDEEADTRGSATIDLTDSLGECYIRTYLITIQNGVKERHPLGTHLIQTPTLNFDGRIQNTSLDAYTPLLELKENPPPLGYAILKDSNIMDVAYRKTREQVRAPVVMPSCDTKLLFDFVSNNNDNWLTYLSDLISNAKYKFDLDELGRILFAPNQELSSLQPVWTYNDDNSSILHSEITLDRDMYGIPNVVEVVYSYGGGYLYSRQVNDDSNSPISTVNRGREIVHRVTDPSIMGIAEPSQELIDEYAKYLLRELSTLECTVSYTHGYCPVRLGDCVRLNYTRAGLADIKAKVVSQSIECIPGCPVTEKAVFTASFWG